MLFVCFNFRKHLLLNKDRPTGRVKNAKKEEETSVDRRAFAGRLTQSPTESRRPSPEARSPKPSPETPTGKYPSGPGRYKIAPAVVYIVILTKEGFWDGLTNGFYCIGCMVFLLHFFLVYGNVGDIMYD